MRLPLVGICFFSVFLMWSARGVVFSVSAARGGSCRLVRLLARVWWGSGPADAAMQGRSLAGWDGGPVGMAVGLVFSGERWA
jgi:hypothetical protein